MCCVLCLIKMFDEGGDLFVFHAKTRSYMIPRLSEALKGREIVASEVSTLIYIHDNPGCSPKDICYSIAVDKSIISNRVKSLIDRGIVEDHSKNKRTYKLYLTKKGITEHDYARNALKDINDSLTVNMTERQKETFIKLMKKITEVAELGYKY